MNRYLCRFLRYGVAALLFGLAHASVAVAADSGNASSVWQPAPYTLGQGLYFPSTGLRIGGYADFNFYDVQGTKTSYNVHDFSLFLTQDIGAQWQLFTEIDAANPVTSRGRTDVDDAELDVERLYVDYHANPYVNFRFGKFLTPVGEWNLVHADPLTWTISRPLSTSAAFALHATGAMMFGTLPVHGNDLDYWVFADDTKNLRIGDDQDNAYTNFGTTETLQNNFRQAVGGRVLYHLFGDSLSVGASALSYELESPRDKYFLSGLDFSWTTHYIDFTGEAIYRSSTDRRPDERGGFVQTEIPLWRRFYLIERYERYRSSTPEQTSTIRTTAINFKPIEGIVLKIEYRDGNHNLLLAPTGWLASAAILF
ncbi:porin [Rhodanobacter hydrolyticus]|uniref:Porin n=1 Tax=Rhodanobacter hydrolyticus TaxID=2250595 RepID=A0ABW8J4Z9_9GAMM